MTDRHTPDWPTRDWPTRDWPTPDWPTPEQRRQLLGVIEGYHDSVPRSTARTETIGAFTLFVAERGWPFYARPRRGARQRPAASHVRAVLDRQAELGVPLAFEWVHETSPLVASAVEESGMTVTRCPLLVLRTLVPGPAVGVEVRCVGSDDPALAEVVAAVGTGFGTPGTAVGPDGPAERDALAASGDGRTAATRAALADGRSVLAGAFDPLAGAVGGGSHNPCGGVSEVVGVAVLPSWRRRGVAAALTATLTRDALERGIATVFCSAQSEQVARVYEGIGFRRIGTAALAEHT